MKGNFCHLGELLEESQSEASRLRQRVEELVRDNEALKSSTSSYATSLCTGGPIQTETRGTRRPLWWSDPIFSHHHYLLDDLRRN